MEVQHHATSVIDGDECSVSCPDCFIPSQVVFGTHIWGGWVGPRIALDPMKRRKICCPPPQEFPHKSLIIQSVAWSLHQLCYPGSSPTFVWAVSPRPNPHLQRSLDMSIGSGPYKLSSHFPPLSISSVVYRFHFWTEVRIFHNLLKLPPVSNEAVFIGVLWLKCETVHSVPVQRSKMHVAVLLYLLYALLLGLWNKVAHTS